jgi:hypothetical protein
MTRDSVVWWIGIIVAVLGAIAANSNLLPADWAPALPWINLICIVLGTVSGKLATSPLRGENDAQKVDVSKIVTPLLVVAVSLSLLTGATCHGKQSPRHDATLNLTALTTGLRALQEGEQTLYRAKTVPQLTPEAHRAFNAKMVQVWDAMSAAVSVVQAWKPGEPIPPQLAELVEKTRVAVDEAAALFGAQLPARISEVWRAVADLLLQTLGGVK